MIQIYKYGEVANDKIFARVEPAVNVEATVTEIIENVKKNGDQALYAYCEKFDGAKLNSLLLWILPLLLFWKRRLPISVSSIPGRYATASLLTIRMESLWGRRSFRWTEPDCMCPAVRHPIRPRC